MAPASKCHQPQALIDRQPKRPALVKPAKCSTSDQVHQIHTGQQCFKIYKEAMDTSSLLLVDKEKPMFEPDFPLSLLQHLPYLRDVKSLGPMSTCKSGPV